MYSCANADAEMSWGHTTSDIIPLSFSWTGSLTGLQLAAQVTMTSQVALRVQLGPSLGWDFQICATEGLEARQTRRGATNR